MTESSPAENLELARRLIEALESDDQTQATELVQMLRDERFENLFQEIGKLTRELHDTINNLAADQRLMAMAHEQIPDARDRLKYVIERTAEATDRTLNAVERMQPVNESLASNAAELRERLASETDAAARATVISAFLDQVDESSTTFRQDLLEVTMAQEFQDLTGQVIGRTIDLVSQVEEKLVAMVAACGEHTHPDHKAPPDDPNATSFGPAVTKNNDVVSRQADVDDLLADLGF